MAVCKVHFTWTKELSKIEHNLYNCSTYRTLTFKGNSLLYCLFTSKSELCRSCSISWRFYRLFAISHTRFAVWNGFELMIISTSFISTNQEDLRMRNNLSLPKIFLQRTSISFNIIFHFIEILFEWPSFIKVFVYRVIS